MKTNRLFLSLVIAVNFFYSTAQDQNALPPVLSEYPDALICNSGRKVLSVQSWEEERRAEVLSLFRENVYGNLPGDFDEITFTVLESGTLKMGNDASFRRIWIEVTRNSRIFGFNVMAYLPANQGKALPSFVFISYSPFKSMIAEDLISPDFWPADKIVEQGFAAFIIDGNELSPDDSSLYAEKVISTLYPEEAGKDNGMKTISAWAWGASRVMDYIEQDALFDKNKVAVIGHSRCGKTALWCGANDERFRLVISNNSGESGAALARRPVGESVEAINTRFPHWFCENYKKYNTRVNELPVDQHMLLSLMAPRYLYVASATEDNWADPLGEFYSLNMSVPVYQLYFPEMKVLDYPVNYLTISSGRIAYHIRKGKHNLTLYDWELYMKFFKSILAES